jgi:hypothetical protein
MVKYLRLFKETLKPSSSFSSALLEIVVVGVIIGVPDVRWGSSRLPVRSRLFYTFSMDSLFIAIWMWLITWSDIRNIDTLIGRLRKKSTKCTFDNFIRLEPNEIFGLR